MGLFFRQQVNSRHAHACDRHHCSALWMTGLEPREGKRLASVMAEMGLEPRSFLQQVLLLCLSHCGACNASLTGFCVFGGLPEVVSPFRGGLRLLVLQAQPRHLAGRSFHTNLESSCGSAVWGLDALVCSASLPSASSWLQDGHVAQAWPIKALNPSGCNDWLKEGLSPHLANQSLPRVFCHSNG